MKNQISSLESLMYQNLNLLKDDCLTAYRDFKSELDDPKKPYDFSKWNPIENIKDAWDIVESIHNIAYTEYKFDGILYDFKIITTDSNDDYVEISASGITINQAICNGFIILYNTDYWRNNLE